MARENYLNDRGSNNNRMAKKRGWIVTSVIIVVIIIAMAFYSININSSKSQETRMGYMTFWAEGAFPAEALQNAGIAEKNNLNMSYVKVQYGPPLVEAALAKKVDVIYTGWVPAINLMSKSDDWVIISRLAYFPMALMARNGSNINKVEELKGKKIGVGYGSGPYPLVVSSLRKQGLIPGKNIELVNMSPADMGDALKNSQIDAVSWVEPSLTLFKQHSLAHSIEEYSDISFIVASRSYMNKHSSELKKLLFSFKESQVYISKNKEKIYKWFSQDSLYDISLVKNLKIIEPNFNVKNISQVNLTITPEWVSETQKKIDFEYNEKIIDKKVHLSEKIDISLLE